MAYIIPTLHPAHLLRGAPVTGLMESDLRKAFRVSIEGPRNYENILVVHPSSSMPLDKQVRTSIAWMDRWSNLKCPIAHDVETSSVSFMGCKLWSIALSGVDGCHTALAFTLADLVTLPWDAQAALVTPLKKILADPRIPNLFHNAPFDYAVLRQKGFWIEGALLDTMAMHHLCQPDIPHDLGSVGHTYLDVEPWKIDHEGRKVALTKDILELLIYNAKDAVNTGKIYTELVDELRDRGCSSKLMQYQMAAAQLAARMELYGIPINYDLRRARGLKLQEKLDDGLAWLRSYLNWADFNPDAHSHVARALYSKPNASHNFAGLTPTAYTETGLPSTSYKSIIDHLENKFVRRLVDWKETRTSHSTIYKDASIDEDGKHIKGGGYHKAIYVDNRLHCKWGPTAQKGSRWSSSPNVQNVAVPHRVIFEAPPGRVMVGADKDQLELRVIACRAGVGELVEALSNNEDPHMLATRNIYGDGLLTKTSTEQYELRSGVKNVVYASIYLAGWLTVWHTVREKKYINAALRALLTKPAVKHIVSSYFGRYLEIPEFHQTNFRLAQSQGYLEIPPLGRRRYYPVIPPPITEVANWPIQTEGSDIVLMEMVHIQEELDARTHGDANIIVHGHDAIYVECATMYAETTRDIIDKHFGNTRIEGPAGVVHLTGKAKIGRNLLEVK